MKGTDGRRADGFETFLAPVAAGTPPDLISASAFEDIYAVASLIPPPLAHNTFGFECRLGETEPRADFFALATARQGRQSLADLHAPDGTSPPLKAHAPWRRVRDFAALWADPSSPLHDGADNVWLEFDVDGPSPTTPLPAVFFGITPKAPPGLLTSGLHALSGGGLAPRVLDEVSRVRRALRPFGRVFQLGLMLSRGPVESVRLCVWPTTPEDLVPSLRRAGWRGEEADLRAVLEPLRRMVDVVALDVDVGATIGGKIGLECYFRRNRQPSREPRWRDLLDFLVREGLCTTRKRDALLAYPGHLEEGDSVPWPGSLLRASDLLGPRHVSAFTRTLNHIKVVYEPGKPLEAKAYLAGNHLWRPA